MTTLRPRYLLTAALLGGAALLGACSTGPQPVAMRTERTVTTTTEQPVNPPVYAAPVVGSTSTTTTRTQQVQ
jgi:hypothetical protein